MATRKRLMKKVNWCNWDWNSKKWVPGSHTRDDGVQTHVCIRTFELKSNTLTTRPPWYSRLLEKIDQESKLGIVKNGDGVQTHVCIRTLELKSNDLTTRPPWFDSTAGYSKKIDQGSKLCNWEYSKKWVPGSHTRDGVRTHVCICTLELESNALTARPPWFDSK